MFNISDILFVYISNTTYVIIEPLQISIYISPRLSKWKRLNSQHLHHRNEFDLYIIIELCRFKKLRNYIIVIKTTLGQPTERLLKLKWCNLYYRKIVYSYFFFQTRRDAFDNLISDLDNIQSIDNRVTSPSSTFTVILCIFCFYRNRIIHNMIYTIL